MCLCGISSDFSLLSPSIRQVTHVLLTRPPLDNVSSGRSFPIRIPFDLHVLGTPPAFILSQDRTLIKSAFLAKSIIRSSERFKFSPSQNALSLFFLNYCKSLFSLHISVLLNFLCRNSGFSFFFRRTSFQESSGSVYYSIFDCQGSVAPSFSVEKLKKSLFRCRFWTAMLL